VAHIANTLSDQRPGLFLKLLQQWIIKLLLLALVAAVATTVSRRPVLRLFEHNTHLPP
jgi:hypothetical protein